VRHHIKEEENEMWPKARELDLDFEALGRRMLARKTELKKDGIPKDAEHAMVARANGKGDSTALRARKTARRKTARKATTSRPPGAAAPTQPTDKGEKKWRQSAKVPRARARPRSTKS
jgi:hypothetical protein